MHSSSITSCGGAAGRYAPRALRRALPILFCFVLPACSDHTGNEARLFLDRVERIDSDDPPERRRPRIEALAALALSSEEVTRARDVCLDAHRALLDAETRQAEARRELDRITANGANPHAPVEPAVGARIQKAIDDSERAIHRSRDLMPRCQDEVGELNRKYGSRR